MNPTAYRLVLPAAVLVASCLSARSDAQDQSNGNARGDGIGAGDELVKPAVTARLLMGEWKQFVTR